MSFGANVVLRTLSLTAFVGTLRECRDHCAKLLQDIRQDLGLQDYSSGNSARNCDAGIGVSVQPPKATGGAIVKFMNCVIEFMRSKIPSAPQRKQSFDSVQLGGKLAVVRGLCHVADRSSKGLGEVSKEHGCNESLEEVEGPFKSDQFRGWSGRGKVGQVPSSTPGVAVFSDARHRHCHGRRDDGEDAAGETPILYPYGKTPVRLPRLRALRRLRSIEP